MKPKLLYIRRDPRDYVSSKVRWETHERDFTVAAALKKFDVDFRTNILNVKPEHVKDYNFIITHLQDDPLSAKFTYELSTESIARIHKEHPQTKIVVYTGASERAITDEQLKEAGATAVIRKRSMRDLQEDAAAVKKCLEEMLP